ncbi:hypothetical protein ANN_11983 [Periplaneta americana]|uniref:Ig-like domain-containing protein n=1 Tax=Periplaneta americana TaxID=6978 RepID=A0ABQ8T8F1_PERAM|nr:hypothetical protein ANN_11983 [Periplaneta americana]
MKEAELKPERTETTETSENRNCQTSENRSWCRAQDNFYFSRNPANTDVVAGSGVTLQCEVSNATGIAYYWQLNGQSIGNTTRRYQRGSNLHITRADRVRDGGQFTCIAMNVSTGFSITSMAASLNIL